MADAHPEGAEGAPPRRRPARLPHGGVRPLLAAALVAALGTGASVTAGAALHQAQERTAEQAMDQRTALVRAIVQAETRRYADTLAEVAAATGAFEELTAAKFTRFTASVPDLRLAGATSIVFLVAATDDRIPRVQDHWRTRGVPDLVLRPHGRGHEHVFVVFHRSMQPGARPTPGLDAAQAPEPARALEEARRTGRVTVSDAYRLLIDRDLPPERRQRSLVMTAPVHGPAGQDGPFIGWVSMGVRGQDFAAAALHRIAEGRIDVRLAARQADGRLVPLAAIPAAGPEHLPRDLHRVTDVRIGQRSWQLRIDASSAALPGAASPLPVVTAAGGSTLSLLLAVLVFTLAGGRARARAQVREATAALRAEHAALRDARDELAGHETYLRQVLDAIEVTVVTCDADGALVHLNQIARAVLSPDPPRTVAELSSRLPLLRADGTPLPWEQTPLMRALDGHDVDGLEADVTTPDGARRTLILHARPLRRTDGHLIGAVVSSYDITALREHQAELQAFAGVVAHDLKRPLSAMRGLAELARDSLGDLGAGLDAGADADAGLDTGTGAEAGAGGVPQRRAVDEAIAALAREQAQLLDRILSGAAQMTRLIGDLLAYAAARDAALHPCRIDLTALAREVADEHLAAVDLAGTAPRLDVRPLPEVCADPSLVRQLLDNLIGNALKYTPPGRPAQVEVTARPAPDGWACVQVADRGIGIPPGEHHAIFTSFHRAAQSYSGTGLGLAICKRVAERHGGAITATDNPGGGARFTFTLPAAPQDEDAGVRRVR
ncbi:ATP-binding protein [Planomonospora sp. ID82291]|uniref:ATP-binding protein n=1 Tax=Planomonospora sp. ID82291 TaxID=2738136 RepID=UPI0018C3BB2B|nr:ATP-binding protein [Planomonospora sp. ID82291]MBG0817855.1 CHASE domain-containing protein [Planomonospora sp. ID82291]